MTANKILFFVAAPGLSPTIGCFGFAMDGLILTTKLCRLGLVPPELAQQSRSTTGQDQPFFRKSTGESFHRPIPLVRRQQRPYHISCTAVLIPSHAAAAAVVTAVAAVDTGGSSSRFSRHDPVSKFCGVGCDCPKHNGQQGWLWRFNSKEQNQHKLKLS
jgi:hypothetical protein